MKTKALWLLAIPLLLALGCGGDGTAEQALTSISGRVVAGPVTGANVTVLPMLNTGALGDSLGIGTTDSQGFFSIQIPAHVGAVVVRSVGGEYVDEATGNLVVAENLQLDSLAVLTGAPQHTVQVTAATTIATYRAMDLAMSPLIDAVDAVENGVAMVEEYYGFDGILTTPPADLTAGPVAPGPPAEYGALNAGFSQLADDRGVHLWSLISRLAQDAADGTFDGHYYGGPLYVDTPSGEGDLFHEMGGEYLKQSIEVFVSEPKNASGLTIDDLTLDGSIDRHIQEDYAFCIYQPRIDVVEPAVGPVGEALDLTLYGQFPDLENVSLVVTFGGVPGEIVKGDTEELRVVAPASAVAGKVDIAIECQNTHVHGMATQAFEYYVPYLTPVITDVKPGAGPSVGGTLIEVTGENFDPTAVVEVGGEVAYTLARLGRTGIVIVAPPGDGTKDIVVRQADHEDDPAAPYAAMAGAFSYFGQGQGNDPEETQMDGQWRAYAIGHQYPETVVLLNTDIVLAGGEFTQSANTWYASPDNPEGSTTTLDQGGEFRVFADGTVWLKAWDQEVANRVFVTDERDVFVYANDANTSGPVFLGAGIRLASGMSNASLAGTWHVGIFSHAYAMGADPREVSSAWGTAEFDGLGHGSARLVASDCPSASDWENHRDAMGSALAYDVAADGTFTVTIPAPDEGGEPIVFQGSVAQARDLAVAVAASGGRAQFLMMVPVATGFGLADAQGSWYGGGISYWYEPFDVGSVFVGETFRSIQDGRGEGLTEVTARYTSDGQENGGMGTEVHAGRTICEVTGLLIGGPSDLSGFVSSSRRFQVGVPATLESGPWADAVDFMGASLAIRRPAVFSSWTIDYTDYNAVGISTEYKEPGQPLSLEEENTSFRTKLSFSSFAMAWEEESSELIGRVREDAGARVEKTVYRQSDGTLNTWLSGDFPEYRGPYVVFGDGRMLMSLGPSQFNQLAASEEDMFEEVVGEITGNADVIVLRNNVNPDGASALIVLARDGTPTLGGVYNYGWLQFTYAGDWEGAGAYFGNMTLNPTTHGVTGYESWLEETQPGDQISRDAHSWTAQGPYSVSGGVVTTFRPSSGVLTGIAAPDGSAFFLVDLSGGSSRDTSLFVALKKSPGEVESSGSYNLTTFAHHYVQSGWLPIPAMKEVWAGPWRVTEKVDSGLVLEERTNTFAHVEREGLLLAGNDIWVFPNASLEWPDMYYRGWFAEGGKIAFLMTTDYLDGTTYPGAFDLTIITR